MESAKKNGMIFNILAKREENYWVGHCLELDIVATADSLKNLSQDIVELIIAQVDYAFSNKNLENLYKPAPPEVWQEFFKCILKAEKRFKIKSEFQKDHATKTFVPPWIIAKTCTPTRENSIV